MNIIPWKNANEEDTTIRSREGEVVVVEEEETISGKTVITKPPISISSSSSSSWMKSKDPRIVRVSRAFGGKDRHSKVSTLRGLRDRRVRLSVPTAIQLYDLQERLGVDQPSKAVDWLLDQAKEEIDELPPLPISPENFSLFNHHHSFLKNLGQDPTTNTNREENDVVFANNHHHIGSYGTYHHNMNHHHHVQQQQQQHSRFQTDYQHQLHSTLVPFPSQILVCSSSSSSTTTTTTVQSLFPSSSSSAVGSMETTDSRMLRHFQMPLMENSSSSSTSQNISTLYSLLHGSRSDHHM